MSTPGSSVCRVYLIIDSREHKVWDVQSIEATLLKQYGVRLITKKDDVFCLPTKAPPGNGAPSVAEALEHSDGTESDEYLMPVDGDDLSEDDKAKQDTSIKTDTNIQLTVGDVWYVCDGHVLRVDEIKVRRDFMNSLRSGHLDEQLTRARTSDVPELGLLVVQDISNLPQAEQLGMLTKSIRQENHKFRRVHFAHIPSEDLLACYFGRVAQTLEDRLSKTKAEKYAPTPAALLDKTKKTTLTSGFMIYQRMLSLVHGINLDRALKIAVIAPGLSELRECLNNDDPHLLALTNKPMRTLLRDLLQMPKSDITENRNKKRRTS